MIKKITSILKSHKESLLLLSVLIFAGLMNGVNMFNYPYFENDEGTYYAQAWSFIYQGKLAPYTYWYDHAPLGWIFSSVWLLLSGGLFTFGFSLNSARVWMLIMHLASAFLLFKVSKKIIKSNLGAAISVIFFSLSPLIVYFQRRMLLDNIMVFWLLLSMYFIVNSKDKLIRYFLGALFFGIAVLTKETAIFFMPVFIWLVYSWSHKAQKLITSITWTVVSGLFIATYPIYALLKGEFFPAGTFLSSGDHVSLLGTLGSQVERGNSLSFLDPQSDFGINMIYWLDKDPFYIYLGMFCFLVVTLLSLKSYSAKIISLFTFSIFVFLIRGGLIINFYILAMVPFFALGIGYVVSGVFDQIKRFDKYAAFVALIIFSLFTINNYLHNYDFYNLFFSNETKVQVDAVNWIKKNIDPKKTITTDVYASLDLINSRFPGDPAFQNSDWYWKVEFDPEIKTKKLADNYKNIDYIIFTGQLFKDVSSFPDSTSILKKVLLNSSVEKVFASQDADSFDIENYPRSHPNGNWVAVLKQNTPQDVLLESWNYYKKEYVTDTGHVNLASSQKVSIADQALTLYRAAITGDSETFKKVYSWTVPNMMLTDKNLFGSEFVLNLNVISNKGTSADADQLIALALLTNYEKTGDTNNLKDAQMIMNDIWKYETAEILGKNYPVAGDWATGSDRKIHTTTPSVLNINAFKKFAKYDDKHDWNNLVSGSYEILDNCSGLNGLLWNWCDINSEGQFTSAPEIDPNSDNFSYNAHKALVWLALDYKLTGDERSLIALNRFSFLKNEWNNKTIYSEYNTRGEKVNNLESLGVYASVQSLFSVTDPSAAQDLYNTKILSKAYKDGNKSYFWGNKSSIFDQNWVWISTAILSDNLHLE